MTEQTKTTDTKTTKTGPMKYNATITYVICKIGGKEETKTGRAYVTAKQVRSATRVWNKEGKQVSKSYFNQMGMRLISYHIDGEELPHLTGR